MFKYEKYAQISVKKRESKTCFMLGQVLSTGVNQTFFRLLVVIITAASMFLQTERKNRPVLCQKYSYCNFKYIYAHFVY